MPHPAKTGLATGARTVAQARRIVQSLARPAGDFNASRYFRGAETLGFYNVGTDTVRRVARTVARDHEDTWTVHDALAFADTLVKDRFLEVKGLGIETLALFRCEFEPGLLPTFKRWLAAGHAANWATTDAVCGALIGPLLLKAPRLVREVRTWSRHPSLWVRRASAVSLIPCIRRGLALDAAYAVARTLHRDPEDLIQKAVGWMLREAGKADAPRLDRYLRANGPRIPRVTVRYAIERFPARKRLAFLAATRAQSQGGVGRCTMPLEKA